MILRMHKKCKKKKKDELYYADQRLLANHYFETQVLYP